MYTPCLHTSRIARGCGLVLHDLGVPAWTLVWLPEVATRSTLDPLFLY